MKLTASIANCVWGALNAPAFFQLRRAIKEPAAAQWCWLRAALARNADCAYGRSHRFAEIRGYNEFASRVPVVDYDDIESWVNRIRQGEQSMLTAEPVTHLIPTSGSTNARKLIPFTAGLQRDFSRAVDAWVFDTARRHPGILLGPAYWSITPAVQPAGDSNDSAVPIGFGDDSNYLGGCKGWLVRSVMLVPKGIHVVKGIEEFRYRTLRRLLRERELRLISCWHPSFLTLLLDALPNYWDEILRDIGKTHPARAGELETIGADQAQALWPKLQVISCWGDGPAATAITDLRRRFPDVAVEEKGLLATEACVTIPFGGSRLPAIRSHFFEYIDEQGRIRLIHELRQGETYEVIVTTSGGLWRYRLRDCVRVAGFAGTVPSLEFIGRSGNVSDLAGEKLSEAFVATAIHETLANCRLRPEFVLLAPDEQPGRCGYTLYVEGIATEELGRVLENRLRQNPHYAYCRDLGQLLSVSVFTISHRGHETFVRRQLEAGMRLGDIKPASLSRFGGWSRLFAGNYV